MFPTLQPIIKYLISKIFDLYNGGKTTPEILAAADSAQDFKSGLGAAFKSHPKVYFKSHTPTFW